MTLTVRPLRIHRYPDEDWVVVGYEKDGVAGEFRQRWLVAPNLPPPLEDGDLTPDAGALRLPLGLDLDPDEAQRARKLLFAPTVAAVGMLGEPVAAPSGDTQLQTSMSGGFRARKVTVGAARYGHLRIFTFNVDSPEAFVAEFVRLANRPDRRRAGQRRRLHLGRRAYFADAHPANDNPGAHAVQQHRTER